MHRPTCQECSKGKFNWPKLMESGYPAPCNWYCKICDKYYDSDGDEHTLDEKKEIQDPSNPGEYMSAFANKQIPCQAIQDLLWRYRHFDINYSIYRIASEFDLNPGIVRAEAAKRCERETS